MDFILDSTVFEVAEAIARGLYYFLYSVGTGVEVLKFVSVAWDSLAHSITRLEDDVETGFLRNRAHGLAHRTGARVIFGNGA